MEPEDPGRKSNLEETVRLLTSLAHGVDPYSGEVYPDDSPYNRPEIIRALFTALEILQKSTKSQTADGTLQRGTSRRWTADMDRELKERYLAGAALPELMLLMGKGRGALIGRLKLLGLIDDADHVRD